MNKLGVESIIFNICGKNKDMNSHLFSADMKLADVIHADYSLLLLLHRFGINLGFGDKTVRECCEANHVSCTLFLMICNVYSNEQYLPTEKEIEGIGANVDQLIAYLKNSHSYYLENRMLSIQEQLKEISEGCEQQHQQILNLFFNEYKNEVIRHFDYEEVTVFPYISNMVKGARPEDYEIGVFRENHSNIDGCDNGIIISGMREAKNKSIGSCCSDRYRNFHECHFKRTYSRREKLCRY